MQHLHEVVELSDGSTITIDRNPASTMAQIIARDPAGDFAEVWLDAYKLVRWAQAMAAVQHGDPLDDAVEVHGDEDRTVTVTSAGLLVFADHTGSVTTKVVDDELAYLVDLAVASSAGL